jgi:hypothetical protein
MFVIYNLEKRNETKQGRGVGTMRREPAAVEPNFPDKPNISQSAAESKTQSESGVPFCSHKRAPIRYLGSVDDSATLKDSVDRGEGFLADLAEDRGSAPPEIVPVIDHYISRVRDVISLAWDEKLSRRELDASLLQVRLCYAQDLDRILQGLLLKPST